jgi:spore maturation protein SpmA
MKMLIVPRACITLVTSTVLANRHAESITRAKAAVIQVMAASSSLLLATFSNPEDRM